VTTVVDPRAKVSKRSTRRIYDQCALAALVSELSTSADLRDEYAGCTPPCSSPACRRWSAAFF